MPDEKPAFLEEEEDVIEEGAPEEEAFDLEGEAPDVEVDVEIDEITDFASPAEALKAAIDEHGTDVEALIAWFDQYGYELIEKGGGEMDMGMEEEPVDFDLTGDPSGLVSMRNKAAAGAFPGEMA
jgi:hypothetical protein